MDSIRSTLERYVFVEWVACYTVKPDPEVIKKNSCSTQLSIKFQLLIRTKTLKKDRYFLLLSSNMMY